MGAGITDEVRAEMRAVAARYPVVRSAMLPCLHLAQEAEGRITLDGVLAVAEVLGVNPDEVESVVTFYSMYHTEPQGRYVIRVCTSISCYLRGCDALLHRVEEALGIRHGETTPDGRFTLDHIECLAACGGAPVLQVNGEFVEHVTPERADALLERLVRGEPITDLAARWRANGAGGFTAGPHPAHLSPGPSAEREGRGVGRVLGAGGSEVGKGRAARGEATGANGATGVRLDVAPKEKQ